ncbi:hypothetical protein ES705_18792 [subsurface metagenome]
MSYWRAKEKTTASALKSVPSWNLTPFLKLKTISVPSADASQEVAKQGCINTEPSSYSTKASKILSILCMDSPSVTSAGSNLTASPLLPNTRVPSAETAPTTLNTNPTVNNKTTNNLLFMFTLLSN